MAGGSVRLLQVVWALHVAIGVVLVCWAAINSRDEDRAQVSPFPLFPVLLVIVVLVLFIFSEVMSVV